MNFRRLHIQGRHVAGFAAKARWNAASDPDAPRRIANLVRLADSMGDRSWLAAHTERAERALVGGFLTSASINTGAPDLFMEFVLSAQCGNTNRAVIAQALIDVKLELDQLWIVQSRLGGGTLTGSPSYVAGNVLYQTALA